MFLSASKVKPSDSDELFLSSNEIVKELMLSLLQRGFFFTVLMPLVLEKQIYGSRMGQAGEKHEKNYFETIFSVYFYLVSST